MKIKVFTFNNFKKYTKNALVIYLALLTGCTNALQNIENSSVQETSPTKIQSKIDNKYNLPSLDLKNPEIVKNGKTNKSGLDQIVDNSTDNTTNVALPPTERERTTTKNSSDLESMAIGLATSQTSDSVKDWFSLHHATAQLNIGASDAGVKTGSLDLLVPLFDTKTDLIFTQLGIRRSNRFTEDYRTTINLGIGYRHNIDDWMLGVNSFYDRDVTGENDRIGLGIEAWTNFLKLSANSYNRLSNWKQSPDLDYYLERPANGWDLRAEAYLPQYPQLGGKLMYEQYYGDNVGLFGPSNRQRDPSATTIGISYTPIPLISLSTNYRQGQNGVSETSFKIGFNLQLGTPLKKQLSPDQVRASRMISNARYNLVNRNNEIVMDYKQEPLGTIQLPNNLQGSSNSTISFPVSITGNISNITWVGTASSYATIYGGGSTASLTVPVYHSNGLNTYSLKAIGTDKSGRAVESNTMQINVESLKLVVESSKPTAQADGADSITFTSTLTSDAGEVVPNSDITWAVSGSASIESQETKTNSLGKAHIKLISRAASLVTVTASQSSGATAATQVSFVTDIAHAKVISVSTSLASITANGTTISTLTAIVQDESGNSIGPNATVNWSTTLGHLSATSSITDNSGKATINFTSTASGSATITALAIKGSANTNLTITPDTTTFHTISLTSQASSVIADDTTTNNISVLVKDASGNLAPAGVNVNWSSTLGNLLSTSTLTDANGKATNSIKSSNIGVATITALTNNSMATTLAISFVANNANATVVNLTSNPAQIVADGVTKSNLSATVQDGNGHAVGASTLVNWSTTIGTLSSTTSLTDANGIATNSILNNVVSNATITASTIKGSSNTSVAFIASNSTATIVSITPKNSTIIANNIASSTITVVVKDSLGNIVPVNTPVNWTTSNNNGTLSSNSSVTNSNGEATVAFTGTIAGDTTITATVAKNSETVVVTLTPDINDLALNIDSVSPNSISANNIDKSTINISLVDKYNNAITSGAITWTSSLGNSFGNTSTTTDTNGKSTNTLYGVMAGNDTITVKYGSLTKTTSITLTAAKQLVKSGSVIATPNTIPADKSTTSTITALIVDDNGNPSPAGVSVNWSLNNSLVTLGSNISLTDSVGKVTNTIVSSSSTAGTVDVTISSKDSTANINVTITPVVATTTVYSINTSTSTVPSDGTTKATLTAVIHDISGNAAPANTTVNWSTTFGTLASTTSVTDGNGIATNTISSLTSGNAVVTATSTSSSKSTGTIVFDNSNLSLATALTASKNPIIADNTDSSVVTAHVINNNGNPVGSGVKVYWTSFDTTSDPKTYTSTTDSSGNASITVKTYDVYGIIVDASLNSNGNNYSEIQINATPTNNYYLKPLTASKTTIEADGIDSSVITARVYDGSNNPVGSGVIVVWNGDDVTYTNSSGEVQYTFTTTTVNSNNYEKAKVVSSSSSASISYRTIIIDSVNTKMSNNNYTISITSSESSLANGESSNITATLTDKTTGNIVTDKIIQLSCISGCNSGLESNSVLSGGTVKFDNPAGSEQDYVTIKATYTEDGNDLYDSTDISLTGDSSGGG